MPLLDSIHLTLLIGPGLPLPAPPSLVETLQSVEVVQRDSGVNGFQLCFALSRGGLTDVLDYNMLLGPLLTPFNRLVLIVTLGAIPFVLMDGIVTHRQHAPNVEPGEALVTLTGEDVSVMMDLQEKRALFPCLPDIGIVAAILAGYGQYQLLPVLIPPLSSVPPLPIERVPTQQGTDLQMLRELAERNGYVFYIEPGPLVAPLVWVNTVYFGPPKRLDLPQSALAISLGKDSNVSKLSFEYDALAPATVADTVQDSLTGARLPVDTFVSTRLPPLVLDPALTPLHTTRTMLAKGSGGLDIMAAYARAQADTDRSVDAVVTAKGELDVMRYGGVLRARSLVGMRGAGFTHDGLYYVQQVTHRISGSSYTQSFVLNREGEDSITPVVTP